jgi:MoxR-like ATPase
MGASARAAVHLLAAAKSLATLNGRRVVTAQDVQATASLVLPHRIIADDPYRVVREAVLSAFPTDTPADELHEAPELDH